ncbi:MAG: iron-containing alcohol dehydrogenase [Phycisphaerae bacterium]|nr:iron-containing alcohol dehydrogenase [Phycisphaerae bacterium]
MSGKSHTRAFFGSTFDCACGRWHAILPRQVLVAPDAVGRLPQLCAGATAGRRVAVLMDARTRDVAGKAVAEALARAWQVQQIVLPDPPSGSPVCDDLTHDALAASIGPVDLIVPVGSGVLCDLGKWLAFERSVPFVPFATAASMNGFASGNVAATVEGVKSLFVAGPPPAVAACPAILAEAPYELTAAGLGDALAKSVSSADWLLNHVLFGDFYCQAAVDLIADVEPLYTSHPADIAARRPAAMGALLDALLLTGSAMTMAGSSAPASGGEHLLSHTLDMMSTLDGLPHDLHGRQVGLGTVLCSELYRRVLQIESPRFLPPVEAIDATFWGRLGEPIAKLYAQKVLRLHQVKAVLSGREAWDELRRRLAPVVRPPETISACLRAAGAAWRAGDIGCDRQRVLVAFSHAHQARARFTVLDLAYLMGLLPASAAEIIDRWA